MGYTLIPQQRYIKGLWEFYWPLFSVALATWERLYVLGPAGEFLTTKVFSHCWFNERAIDFSVVSYCCNDAYSLLYNRTFLTRGAYHLLQLVGPIAIGQGANRPNTTRRFCRIEGAPFDQRYNNYTEGSVWPESRTDRSGPTNLKQKVSAVGC